MFRFVAGLAALTLAMPAVAQDPARMDTVIRADADAGTFMGAVLVAKDGKILLDKGYGSANLEWKVANDGNTKFRIGSLTKQFTAAAILLLVEQGKVKLDAPVKTYLSDAPAAWDGITVQHLVNHTAGLPNYTDFPELQTTKTFPTSVHGLIGRFRDKPLDFAPGEKWNYSNSGYVVLTAIIEKTSGQPYAAFIADNILKPLGMADSGYDVHATILPRRASGYSPTAKGPVNADYVDMSVPTGAGALYSTTHDLLKWQTGLFGGKLLKPASLTTFLTPGKGDYGFGVMVTKANGVTTVSHSGGIDGFNTWMAYDPASKISVIVLGNLNGAAPAKLGASLLTLARGGSVALASERTEMKLSAAALPEYAGVYEITPQFAIAVTAGDGQLFAQATGQDKFQLFAEKPDHFFLKVVDAQLVFSRDAAGKINGATLFQGGQQIKAVRK